MTAPTRMWKSRRLAASKRNSVNVDGLRELGEAMRELGAEVSQKIAHRMVSKAARMVRDEAKRLAPVRTGFMKQNIIVKKMRKSETDLTSEYRMGVRKYKLKYADTKYNVRKRRAGTYYGVDDAYYWRYLEFGTVKMAPKPFMRPAFDNNRMRAVEVMKETGRRLILAAAQKAGSKRR